MNGKSFARRMHNIIMAVCACALTAPAQATAAAPPGPPAADEAAVRENVRRLEAGWNAKSGAEFAAPFAADADFVVINGTHLRGRAAIAAGHQQIFDTFFKESTLSLAVRQFRLPRPDVAIVHVDALLRVPQSTGPPRGHSATITLVMLKDAGAWRIAAFQNTAVAEVRR